MALKPLTPKEKTFVAEYLKDKNGARAAREAGYAPNSAKVTAANLLTKPNVKAAVKTAIEKQEKRTEISADRLIKRIAEFAFDRQTAKDVDILKACDMLGRHFNIFTDNVNLTGALEVKSSVVILPAKRVEPSDS